VATETSGRAGGVAQETIDRIRKLNERIIENARKAGDTYLEVYERSLQAIVDYQKGVADATPIDWVKNVLDAQAVFTRELGEMYAAAAREALKKH
jgi:hypothetical protein